MGRRKPGGASLADRASRCAASRDKVTGCSRRWTPSSQEMDSDLRVSEELTIPSSELVFRTSRSGGPGGQHVNTSSTRVELIWSVRDSPSLTDAQRELIFEKLGNRITAAGDIVLAESGSRSQLRNRKVVTARLRELLADALT